MAPNPRRLDARLEAVYEQVPKIACQGLCHDSCGPIEVGLRERQRIEQRAGKQLACGAGASCTMLTDDRRCSVYDIRPLLCRLWGVLRRMRCPYGCKPERYLSDEEGFVLMAAMYEIAGAPDRSGLDRLTKELAEHLLDTDEGRRRAIEAAARMHTPTVDGRYRGALPRTVIDR